ncbi:O-FucT domain protein [Ceratobasidium sp. AG-Ba]|nr:O-FucT domain protein [Ceratobasidium sp. AG-Ba]
MQLSKEHGYFAPQARMRIRKLSLRKTSLLATILCTLGAGVCYTLSERIESSRRAHAVNETQGATPITPTVLVDSNPTVLLNNNATIRFRDNLSPSHKYVTTFTIAGFTNQVIATVNLIYLAILTGRTPIIPPLLPDHFGNLDTVAPIAFSDIFDIPRLTNELNIPVIEWHEVKIPTSPEIESIGCWNTGSVMAATGNVPPSSDHPHVSYTPVPSTFTLSRGAIANDIMFSAWALASLAYPKSRQLQLNSKRPHILPDHSGRKIEPDDQLLCFDALYYVGLIDPSPAYDFFAEYSPFWSRVGTHLHWKSSLTDLATQYLRRHFGVADDDLPPPPFISVHIRRTDFKQACSAELEPEKCFAPIKAYERRVSEIKQSLQDRPDGIEVTRVLVTSDEDDPEWWKQVAALGPEWSWIDHTAEKTAETHGQWYPLILDAVIQSMGIGFVGTQQSTMSQIAWRRVEDWQNGLGVEVRWGRPGADDH